MAQARRLFVPPEAVRDGGLTLEGEVLRHVRTVLRLRAGSEFTATDGTGAEYRARLERLGRDEASAVVLERTEPVRESPLATVLVQALPKADRFALVLEKAVELGVSAIIPVLTSRTVPAGAAAGRALARWRRIVESAVAQCGRTRLPELHAPRAWEDLVSDAGLPELRILLWEGAGSSFGAIVDRHPAPRAVLVAVGPEGGFSDEEAARAQRSGFQEARFGPRTLRTETAGLAALAALQHRWGDLR